MSKDGWDFPRTEFYKDLGYKEASNNYRAVNEKTRYIGLYQMGERALVDVGYYKKLTKPSQKEGQQYNNDWKGEWLGKNGIHNVEDFLSNDSVQDIAIREYHSKIWNHYLKKYHGYEGTKIEEVTLTKAGMIAASHLVGFGGLIEFIKSEGKINAEDKSHITCLNYLKGFEKGPNGLPYEVDYSYSALQKAYDESQVVETDSDEETQEDESKDPYAGHLGANKAIDDLLKDPAKMKAYHEAWVKEVTAPHSDSADAAPLFDPETEEKAHKAAEENAGFLAGLVNLANSGPAGMWGMPDEGGEVDPWLQGLVMQGQQIVMGIPQDQDMQSLLSNLMGGFTFPKNEQ